MSTADPDFDIDAGDPVRVRLDHGYPGDLTLCLRVSPDAAPEIRELMEAQGVFSGEILEHAAGPELIVLAGSFAGGLGGLAAVLTAYFHRNRHKSITFSAGDESMELKGYSDDEAKSLIVETLEDLRAKQLERDKEWKRALGDEKDDD